MIRRIAQAALDAPFVVFMLVLGLVVAGLLCYSRLDIEAYPDPVPPLVEVITQLAFYAGWPSAVTAVGVAKEVFDRE